MKVANGIKKSKKAAGDFMVELGQLTFDAEGMEQGKYHSRTPHVPTDSSGLTIGRGYDLKEKTEKLIVSDLIFSGLDSSEAKKYAKGVGLVGDAARKFIKNNKLVEITPKQQKKLFQLIYTRLEQDVVRICNKFKVIKDYGKVDWGNLCPAIKDIVIDLRFRGDYNPGSRRFIQKSIVDNNLNFFTRLLSEHRYWKTVPKARFLCRVKYLEKNLRKGTEKGIII